MRNPHFDDDLVAWSDEYSGRYQPPPNGYPHQFDLQWSLALRDDAFGRHPGASFDATYIDDRIYEWTGRHPDGTGFSDPSGGCRVLDHPLDENLIRGKRCIDIGCGPGRWTRTMQALGADSVLSVDMSESALQSVSLFNDNVLQADVLSLPDDHAHLIGAFDFANLWGVAQHTHDPSRAFTSAASTVKHGGALYLMVYAEIGMHGTRLVNAQRKYFPRAGSVHEKLAYVDRVHARAWDRRYPFVDNLKNVARNLLGRPRSGKVGILDLLSPFYNWVVPLPVIHGWMAETGFNRVQLLNEHEPVKCAYHMLGIKGQ